jgi:hypothetical protein
MCYFVDDGHMFAEGCLSLKWVNFSELIFHITPDHWDSVSNGIFVLYVYVRKV